MALGYHILLYREVPVNDSWQILTEIGNICLNHFSQFSTIRIRNILCNINLYNLATNQNIIYI